MGADVRWGWRHCGGLCASYKHNKMCRNEVVENVCEDCGRRGSGACIDGELVVAQGGGALTRQHDRSTLLDL